MSTRKRLRLLPGGKEGPLSREGTEQKGPSAGTIRVFELLREAIVQEDDASTVDREAALEQVYREHSTEDPELVIALARFEEEGLISNRDRLYLFVLFSVAKEHGPIDLNGARDALVRDDVDLVQIAHRIRTYKIDDVLRAYLLNGLERVFGHAHTEHGG